MKRGVSLSLRIGNCSARCPVTEKPKIGRLCDRRQEKEIIDRTLGMDLGYVFRFSESVSINGSDLERRRTKNVGHRPALMARPRILTLDEPSLGLAPKIINVIMDTVNSINQTARPF